jgi:hypothetical protein
MVAPTRVRLGRNVFYRLANHRRRFDMVCRSHCVGCRFLRLPLLLLNDRLECNDLAIRCRGLIRIIDIFSARSRVQLIVVSGYRSIS